MSFQDDVDRWAGHQLTARAGSSRKLREAIERLLRGRPSQALDPLSPGAALVAEILEGRRPAPYDQNAIAPVFFERGLYLVVSAVPRVYAGTDLALEWAGDPPHWGWETGAGVQVNGQMSLGTYVCTGAKAPTWTGAPTLDGADSYASSASLDDQTTYVGDNDRDPVRYTGLLRLYVQACGPHAAIDGLRPASWPAWDPRWYGLVRQRDEDAQTLRYWLVYLGADGCKAVRLAWSALVRCLVNGLYAGSWGPEQATLAEAWVLRTLEPVLGTEQDLLDDTDLADAHDGGYGPLAHGWHFSPQRWGSASEEQTAAVMLAAAVDNPGSGNLWSTRRCTVTLSFSGTASSAGLDTAGAGETSLHSNHHLWSWNSTNGNYDHLVLTSTASAQSGDIWACYRADGPQWIEYVYSYTASAPAQSYLAALGVCGGGSAESQRRVTSVTNIYAGGFAGLSVSFTSDLYTSEDMALTPGSSGEVSGSFCVDPYAQGVFETSIETPSGSSVCSEPAQTQGPNYDVSILGAQVTFQTADGQFFYATPTYKSGGDYGAALLLTRDPTVYIGATQWYKNANADANRRTYAVPSGLTSCQWINGDAGGGSTNFAWGVYSTVTHYGAYGAVAAVYTDIADCGDDDGSAADITRASGFFLNTLSYSDATWIPANHSHGKTKAQLFADGLSLDLENASEDVTSTPDYWLRWRDFCRPVAPIVSTSGPDAIASYGVRVVYRPTATEDYTTPDGYDATAVAASSLARFIGDQ